jgi:hypothetical protein
MKKISPWLPTEHGRLTSKSNGLNSPHKPRDISGSKQLQQTMGWLLSANCLWVLIKALYVNHSDPAGNIINIRRKM